MRKLLLASAFVIIHFFISCYAQDTTRQLTFKEIGWTIQIPEDFTLLNAEENKLRVEKSAKSIENASGINADLSQVRTLFTAIKQGNYIAATISPFNPEVDGNYDETVKNFNDLMVKTANEKRKDVVLDTITTKEVIDGVSFTKFQITASINQNIFFNSYILFKLYKGFAINIMLSFNDDATKKQMESALKASIFFR